LLLLVFFAGIYVHVSMNQKIRFSLQICCRSGQEIQGLHFAFYGVCVLSVLCVEGTNVGTATRQARSTRSKK